MENRDTPDMNVAGARSRASSPRPEADPMFTDDGASAKAPQSRSHSIMSRLADRWWQILLLWLVVSVPISLFAYLLIQPTYEASSLLRIEPAQPPLFDPISNRGIDEDQNPTYLKTQVGLITSAKVLDPAIANSLVVNLPMIKKSADPKSDLLEKLKVVIIENTNLIRVSLELPNPDDAVTIVQAVVQQYLAQNTDYSRTANRDLTDSLKAQLVKLATEIARRRSQLRDLNKNGMVAPIEPRELLNPKTETDPTQPTINKATEEQFARLVDKQVQCDLEYLDALAQLEATKSVRERNLGKINDEMEARAVEEFKRNPTVAGLLEQIAESEKLGGPKNQAPSPAVLAAREKHEKLSKDYDALWAIRRPGIRQRLADGDQGLLSPAKIRELEVNVDKTRRKKEGFAQQFEKVKVIRESANDDAFEVTFLTRQVDSLMNWQDQIKKNLEQLMFEASQDRYRVFLVDSASVPKIPSNNNRLKFMAAAPICALFLILGLFMLREIRA
jgi:polysaccharide biosynthesis transport protein